MSIVPTWPIAAGALAVGMALGAGADHLWMDAKLSRAQAEYDHMVAAHAEQERVRQVQRAEDENKARQAEKRMAARVGEIEQEKINAIAQVRTNADALVDRLRKQAASKPTRPSPMPGAATACAPAAGGELSVGSGERVVRLAERADALRAGLAACYRWADTVEAQSRDPNEPRDERQDD